MTKVASQDQIAQQLGFLPILVLAVSAGVATATSYTLQPEIRQVAEDLGAAMGAVGVATGLPVAGYMIGLALLVPLVDRFAARRLVSMQLFVLGLLLAAASLAPDVILLGAALFLSGVCASTGAQMSTLAGKHSSAGGRGRALGAVTAGISAGVLLGRFVGGGLSDLVGWRLMLTIVACACFTCAAVCAVVLPDERPPSGTTYLARLASMPGLLVTYAGLRIPALAGSLWFFAFSLIWTGLSLALALPPMSLTPTVIGLYSLAGVAGVVATRLAGRLADRFGSRPVVLAGLLLALLCTAMLAPTLTIAPLTLVALALFDTGLFAAQVANQRAVLDISPREPARFNSVYMVVYFVGGSLGTIAAGPLVSSFGWSAVVLVAATALLFAGGLYLRARPS